MGVFAPAESHGTVTTYVALLYSVVLTAERRVGMGDLKAMAADLGFAAPRTVASTGNLIFETEETREAVLEAAFAARFGRPVDILLRTAEDWRRLAAANPFPAEAAEDGASVHVRVMRKAPSAMAVEALRSRAVSGERMVLVERDLWVHFPQEAGRSKLLPVLTPRHLDVGTLRNANIVERIARAL